MSIFNEKEIEKKVDSLLKINPLEEVETKEEVFKNLQTLCLIPDDPSHEPLEELQPISTRHYFWTSFWFHERPDSRSPGFIIGWSPREQKKIKIMIQEWSYITRKREEFFQRVIILVFKKVESLVLITVISSSGTIFDFIIDHGLYFFGHNLLFGN